MPDGKTARLQRKTTDASKKEGRIVNNSAIMVVAKCEHGETVAAEVLNHMLEAKIEDWTIHYTLELAESVHFQSG
jgi:hypothetical protein